MKNVFIFIPDILGYNETQNLRGFVKHFENTTSFYILTDICYPIIGLCNDNTSQNNHPLSQIHIDCKTGQISVNGINKDAKITCIMYDYVTFKRCSLSMFNRNNHGENFSTLIHAVQNEKLAPSSNGHSFSLIILFLAINILLRFLSNFHKLLKQLRFILRYSVTALHMQQTVDTLKWALKMLKRQQSVSLCAGNVIMSKITDFLCGLVVLYIIMQYKAVLIHLASETTESIIQALEHLLHFLMGSPAGLKLNSTFNLTLGTFFSYHVTLWRAFLHTTTPLLHFALYLLVFPGACGLSFQAALLSDLVAFSSFHIYCIYVYAARLYGVQIKGLISLWRLFIGRKYNPLRKRVDSHQYTHNQLFVGTLVFTVLLFLFPTTFLYYAVFAVFRIVLLLLNGVLLRLRHGLQCFPIYMMILWLKNSPSVRGAVKLSLMHNSPVEDCKIYVSLLTLPFWENMRNTLPETLTSVKPISLKVAFRAILMGSLI